MWGLSEDFRKMPDPAAKYFCAQKIEEEVI
jgi:hypothetical protein